MSTAAPATGPSPAVLHDIDWGTYLRLLRAFDGRQRFRLTYDRGTLEIISPLWEHERPAYLLGRFIDVLTEELRLLCRAGRSVTLRRKKHRRTSFPLSGAPPHNDSGGTNLATCALPSMPR